LQREDEVYNGATSVALSPPKLEQDREDGSRLFGEWNYQGPANQACDALKQRKHVMR
jgi:hypothetical protein